MIELIYLSLTVLGFLFILAGFITKEGLFFFIGGTLLAIDGLLLNFVGVERDAGATIIIEDINSSYSTIAIDDTFKNVMPTDDSGIMILAYLFFFSGVAAWLYSIKGIWGETLFGPGEPK